MDLGDAYQRRFLVLASFINVVMTFSTIHGLIRGIDKLFDKVIPSSTPLLHPTSISIPSFSTRLLSYEGVEVINPEGGKEDAEEEAQKGRWKDEVTNHPIVS